MPRSWAARMVSVPSQMSDGDQPAHRAAVAPLQEIADREIAVGDRLAPHARPDPERQHERSDPGRSVPPPRAQRPRRNPSDVAPTVELAPMLAARNVAKDEPGAQAPPGDEELAGPRAPADPQPERDEERSSRREGRTSATEPRQLFQIPGGGVAGDAARGANAADDRVGHGIGSERAEQIEIRAAGCVPVASAKIVSPSDVRCDG